MSRPRVVVIGAGMAGLTAAHLLTAVADAIVLDKGRGVGGRLATRRIGDATLDHGAQFITTHSAEFAATVGRWVTDGVVAPWFRGRIGPEGVLDPDGHTRFRGSVSMNAVAKNLAVGLDVRTAS
ncbi:MAG: NAD(P)-binding protein, partial [Actinobacteria bacterium]|nr:NAD(P)-binding protein [Actinomycetota bacterium]